MRVLVIEDDKNKAGLLEAMVKKIDSDAVFGLCTNVRDSLLETDRAMYDVIILDLMLPLTDDGSAQDAGREILNIISRSHLNRSARVVALTAYENLFENQERLFAEAGVFLVYFDESSDEWRKTIKSLLRSVAALPRCDLVVICALEIERCAFGNTTARLGEGRVENGLDVWSMEIGDYNGNIILLPRPGVVDASIIAVKAVERYRPRLVAMSGICAGIRERVRMGQVLVCETCWEYQVGKFASDGFRFEPYQISVSEGVRQTLSALCRSETVRGIIYRDSLPDGVVEVEPKMATMVSGSAVVADENIREAIRTQHRKIDGIEMELAGVYRAIKLTDDGIVVVGVKAVSDFADENKNDDMQRFAATASAHFVVEAIEALLP